MSKKHFDALIENQGVLFKTVSEALGYNDKSTFSNMRAKRLQEVMNVKKIKIVAETLHVTPEEVFESIAKED